MPRMHWKNQRLLASVIFTAIIYFIIRIRDYNHKATVVLEKVKPIDVWEFVADFSNMRYLNPTM